MNNDDKDQNKFSLEEIKDSILVSFLLSSFLLFFCRLVGLYFNIQNE